MLRAKTEEFQTTAIRRLCSIIIWVKHEKISKSTDNRNLQESPLISVPALLLLCESESIALG